MEPHRIVWLAALALISGFALWKGGPPERLFALVNVAASFATRFTENHVQWLDPQWGWLVVDTTQLAVLLGLAVVTDRAWVLFGAAFQLLQIVTHAAMVLDHSLRGWAYITGLVIFSYLTLFSLGVGTWLNILHERRVRYGAPNWSTRRR